MVQPTEREPVSVGPHILVVEDDPELREFMAHYLGDFDLRVSCASDGTTMRKALAHSVVDLVLLDLKLPDEDGLMLARELRASSSIPIIMVTSRNGEADRVLGLELGADDYLTKPFSVRELVARIRTILRRSRAHPAPVNDGPRGLRFAGWELDLRSRRLHLGFRRPRRAHPSGVRAAARVPCRAPARAQPRSADRAQPRL